MADDDRRDETAESAGVADCSTKRALNEQFARIAKATAHPGRLELLELLAQGERPVDALVRETGLPTSTVSTHLRVLRQARVVETRRDGNQIFYRLAGDEVSCLLAALQAVAAANLAEVSEISRDFLEERDALEPVPAADLLERVRDGEVVVVDVRPATEYRSGHIPDALSIPLEELEERISELPTGTDVVAYCRGPYCVLAAEAVATLRRQGRRARRLDDGFPEWRLAGLPVAVGEP